MSGWHLPGFRAWRPGVRAGRNGRAAWNWRDRPKGPSWRQRAPWGVAVLALVIAAGLQGLAVPMLQQAAQDDDRAALRLLQERAAAAASADQDPAWRASLPDATAREARLSALLEAAVRNGLQVQAVDQSATAEAVPGISLQRIDLSARGRYQAVRQFIEEALAADRGLALEHVSLLRQQADAAEVEARLKMSLLQRAADGNAVSASASTPPTTASGMPGATPAVARGPWRAPSAEAVAAWSAPQPVWAPAPARTAPAPAVVAAAAPATAPAPPAPRAPALAYELIGTVADAAGAGALLAGPQRSLWVRAGDSIDSDWRVQRVDASGVDLLWLPQQLPARLNYRTP